jgi:hypothetical protein
MEADKSIEAQIRYLEERLLQPDVRKIAADVAALLAAEFIEFGSSGQIFDREQIISALQHEPPMHWSLTNFKTSQLASDVVLATYMATRYSSTAEPPVYSLRSSIWKRIDGQWRIIFHQGTRSQGP